MTIVEDDKIRGESLMVDSIKWNVTLSGTVHPYDLRLLDDFSAYFSDIN